MPEKRSAVIAAVSVDGVYGTSTNKMPWKCPKDMEHFKGLTIGHTVAMGRNTWESLPAKFRPLPIRDNIVITSNAGFLAEGASIVPSVEEAVRQARTKDVFFIGGRNVWNAAMGVVDEAFITIIYREYLGKKGALIAPEIVYLGEKWEDFVLVETVKEFDEDPVEHVSFHVHFQHWVRQNG